MAGDRREFIGTLLAAGAVVGSPAPVSRPDEPPPRDTMPWRDRIRGKHRAVFDNPRDDSTGIIRAWIWLTQCIGVLGAREKDCTAVVVLRHAGLTLAMDDGFWDRYELTLSGGTADKPNIPRRNPAMAAVLKESGGMFPPPARPWAEGVGLDRLIERGGIVVACEFAFWGVVSRIMQRDKVAEPEAREQAVQHMVKGVTLVPSGFLGLAIAQERGCSFITNV